MWLFVLLAVQTERVNLNSIFSTLFTFLRFPNDWLLAYECVVIMNQKTCTKKKTDNTRGYRIALVKLVHSITF